MVPLHSESQMNPPAVSILQLALNGRWRCPTHAQLSNAKWQQQKVWLSQWCKSQRTSGNVELLRVVREGGKREGRACWLGEKERGWDGKGVGGGGSRGDEAGKVEGWGSGAQGANREAAKAEWRDGWIKSGSLDRGECGRCSLSGLQSVSGVPLFPSGRTTRPCLILRSHPLTYHVLMHPLVPGSALHCTVIWPQGWKIDCNVFVAFMQNCILSLGLCRWCQMFAWGDHTIPILF